MTLLRGIADDVPLKAWLEQHIWPREARFVAPEFVYDGTLLAAAEMLRGGITCCNDMYFYPGRRARARYDDAGMRAMLGMPVLDFPDALRGRCRRLPAARARRARRAASTSRGSRSRSRRTRRTRSATRRGRRSSCTRASSTCRSRPISPRPRTKSTTSSRAHGRDAARAARTGWARPGPQFIAIHARASRRRRHRRCSPRTAATSCTARRRT